MIESCKNCMLFRKVSGTNQGRCLRYPPRVLPRIMSLVDGKIETEMVTEWPLVLLSDTCGEWRQVSIRVID